MVGIERGWLSHLMAAPLWLHSGGHWVHPQATSSQHTGWRAWRRRSMARQQQLMVLAVLCQAAALAAALQLRLLQGGSSWRPARCS
jgi:hypothetical protein